MGKDIYRSIVAYMLGIQKTIEEREAFWFELGEVKAGHKGDKEVCRTLVL